jgi:hypothetical protein
MTQVRNVNSVSIDELRTLIPIVGKTLTVVVQSEPGCGKTSLLKMAEEDHGDAYDYIYVDCPVKDMTDIGMNMPNHSTKSLDYYVASLFKLDGPTANKPKFILLDEMMKAPKMLQVIFTRLMLERMVGDRALPEGSVIMATSNNQTDGVGDTMLAHAGNRVCILQMRKPTAKEWLVYATKKGISRVIRTWVQMYPKCMASYLDPDQKDNPYIFKPTVPALSFCSPRSLEKCDVIVRNADILGPNATSAALAGTIGASAAADMAAFLMMEKSLTDVKDIVKNPDNTKIPDEIAAQLMICMQAVDTLDVQDDLTKFMGWVNRLPSAEVQSIFFTMMMRNPKSMRLAAHNEQIRTWTKENHELF